MPRMLRRLNGSLDACEVLLTIGEFLQAFNSFAAYLKMLNQSQGGFVAGVGAEGFYYSSGLFFVG